MKYSLSRYFPKGTEYFYYFPNEQESNFFGFDPPWAEELFATPPLMCAGEDVKVVVFESAYERLGWKLLYNEINQKPINGSSLVLLPKKINDQVNGKERTAMIKKALLRIITPGKLIMSQPLLGSELEHLYQISPQLSVFLNDKKNLSDYVPRGRYPERYVELPDGEALSDYDKPIEFPCVVKVSSSAAGEGVHICRNNIDFDNAKKKFTEVKSNIFVEQYIDHVANVGVQFGIPVEKDRPIELLGFSRQFTSADGVYMGSILDLNKKIKGTDRVASMLLNEILPKIREKGWYGVGGFDVLIDSRENFYFIDCNFRMTAMTTFMNLLKSGEIDGPIFTFTGIFQGSEKNFREKIVPLAMENFGNQKIKLVVLLEENGVFHFTAGVFFKEKKEISEKAKNLLNLGIKSEALDKFAIFAE